MIKNILVFLLIGLVQYSYSQKALELPKWKDFFEKKEYLKKGQQLTDDRFWEISDSYPMYDTCTLLLIYTNGASEELKWQYDGLSVLIDKTKQLLDENFERVEKENIAYIAFDGYLFRNPRMGNAVAGDFTIVLSEGPFSVFREYYTSPITRENTSSGLVIMKNGKIISDFYLGKFEKKASKLVSDYEELSFKIRSQKAGYFNRLEDIIRISNEYNEWVKETNIYRYDDWSGLIIDR